MLDPPKNRMLKKAPFHVVIVTLWNSHWSANQHVRRTTIPSNHKQNGIYLEIYFTSRRWFSLFSFESNNLYDHQFVHSVTLAFFRLFNFSFNQKQIIVCLSLGLPTFCLDYPNEMFANTNSSSCANHIKKYVLCPGPSYLASQTKPEPAVIAIEWSLSLSFSSLEWLTKKKR